MKTSLKIKLSLTLLSIITFCMQLPGISFARPIHNSNGSNLSISSNHFKYSSYYEDPETGLYYLKARYYSPESMRFISRDTYDLSNRYSYCGGSPIGNIDPNGHSPWDIGKEFLMGMIPGYNTYEAISGGIRGNAIEELAGLSGVICDALMFGGMSGCVNYARRIDSFSTKLGSGTCGTAYKYKNFVYKTYNGTIMEHYNFLKEGYQANGIALETLAKRNARTYNGVNADDISRGILAKAEAVGENHAILKTQYIEGEVGDVPKSFYEELDRRRYFMYDINPTNLRQINDKLIVIDTDYVWKNIPEEQMGALSADAYHTAAIDCQKQHGFPLPKTMAEFYDKLIANQ